LTTEFLKSKEYDFYKEEIEHQKDHEKIFSDLAVTYGSLFLKITIALSSAAIVYLLHFLSNFNNSGKNIEISYVIDSISLMCLSIFLALISIGIAYFNGVFIKTSSTLYRCSVIAKSNNLTHYNMKEDRLLKKYKHINEYGDNHDKDYILGLDDFIQQMDKNINEGIEYYEKQERRGRIYGTLGNLTNTPSIIFAVLSSAIFALSITYFICNLSETTTSQELSKKEETLGPCVCTVADSAIRQIQSGFAS